MERQLTTREQSIVTMAEDYFSADDQFTYVNREMGIAVTLTLREALDRCRYIVDASNEEVMSRLVVMNELAKNLAAKRKEKLAKRAIEEGRA